MRRRRMTEQNKSARIEDVESGMTLEVKTTGRDEGTMTARADVRLRNDVTSGRSLTGLSVKTAGGRSIRFTGAEARTLYRLLANAADNLYTG